MIPRIASGVTSRGAIPVPPVVSSVPALFHVDPAPNVMFAPPVCQVVPDAAPDEVLRLGVGLLGILTPFLVERLTRARPATLAAAGRVPGVTPAALAALLGTRPEEILIDDLAVNLTTGTGLSAAKLSTASTSPAC